MGLEHLLSLHQLENLYITFTAPEFGGPEIGVTDAGICRLAQLPNLRRLSVIGTNVSDKTARALAQFEKLQEVDLSETNVSEEAAERLRKLRPELSVGSGPL